MGNVQKVESIKDFKEPICINICFVVCDHTVVQLL
jgi:hypothetical protein